MGKGGQKGTMYNYKINKSWSCNISSTVTTVKDTVPHTESCTEGS